MEAGTIERWVKALRADPEVGVGTCSTIDECMTDEELAEELCQQYQEGTVRSQRQAIQWARQSNAIFWSVMKEREAAT